jgi:hypothetical protein
MIAIQGRDLKKVLYPSKLGKETTLGRRTKTFYAQKTFKRYPKQHKGKGNI